MSHRFADIAFTPAVKKVQEAQGSRAAYSGMEGVPQDVNGTLTASEAGFIGARDSLYMASVSETGWPYIQHRGGPVGFVRTLGPHTIGFADFRGNRQYISLGNLGGDDRVWLFFMEYPNKTRLKLLGRVRIVEPEDTVTPQKLNSAGYKSRVERGFLITVEGFDWNCPQHITERFTRDEVCTLAAPLFDRITALEAQLAGTAGTSPPGTGGRNADA